MNEDQQSEQAFEYSKSLLKALESQKIDLNIGQAALGGAWCLLCKAMGFSAKGNIWSN